MNAKARNGRMEATEMKRSLTRQLFLWGTIALIFVSLAGCGASTPEPPVTGDTGTHLTQGRQYMEQGNIAEAIAEFQAVIRLDPGSVEGHFRLGNAYFQQGDLENAAKEFQQ